MAYRISPIEPRTAGSLKGWGFTVTWGDDNSETTNGGSDDSHPRPEPEAVNLDRRRHHNDDIETQDTHHDVGAVTRPVNVSEEPGRSLASDTSPPLPAAHKPDNDEDGFKRVPVIGSVS